MPAPPASEDLIKSIQNQLEGLKKTPDGLFLYRLIDRGLQRRSGNYTGDTARDFIGFLHGLLQRYATNPDGDTVTRVKVRLLQQRLAPHMMDSEARASPARDISPGTTEAVDVVAAPLPEPVPEIAQAPEPTVESNAGSEKPVSTAGPAPESFEVVGLEIDESAFAEDPVQAEPGFSLADAAAELAGRAASDSGPDKADDNIVPPFSLDPAISARPGDAPSRHEIEINPGGFLAQDLPEKLAEDETAPATRPLAAEEPLPNDTHEATPADTAQPDIIVGEVLESNHPQNTGFATSSAEAPPPLARRGGETEDIRDSSRERVDRLHETFAGKLADSISRNEDYTTLLRSNLKALKLADSPDDVLDIRYLLVRGLEDLLKGNQALSKDLGATNHYLKISQLDRNLLKDELGRVRDQSLVDELTGLQNRTAFNKQLSAEIGRSKRYGFSLALSLVVLDDFDSLRESQGKDAANEVLRTFSQQILAGFRGYDAVARLNDCQFGILFPNTQKEGALSALEKAQKQAAETVIQFNGRSLRLPTFTSSMTLYSPGDKPEAIMKRTYDALALATKNSRDKIVVALAQT